MKIKFLVEVEALWDVRLATLGILDPKYATSLMNGKWKSRKSDDIIYKSGVSKETYTSALKKYADDALVSSVRTSIAEFIMDAIGTDLVAEATPHNETKYEFVLNTHGYDLDDEDCEIIYDTIAELVPLLHEFSRVDISPADLTPEIIKAREYTVHVVYDLEKWMAPIIPLLEECRLPTCYIVAPDIMVDPDWQTKLTKKELEDLDGWTPAQVLEYFSTEFYPIRFIPVQTYCAVI